MSEHFEFPELTPEANKLLAAAYKAAFPWHDGYNKNPSGSYRRGQAAFLREAMKQALASAVNQRDVPWNADQRLNALIEVRQAWDLLEKIADNFHSPPPPPPTLAQAQEADLDTPEGKAVVRDFLATLGEGGQP